MVTATRGTSGDYHSYESVQQAQPNSPVRASEHMRRYEHESRDLEHWVTVLEDGLRHYGGPMDTKSFRQSMAEARTGEIWIRSSWWLSLLFSWEGVRSEAGSNAPRQQDAHRGATQTRQDMSLAIEIRRQRWDPCPGLR